MNSLLQKTEEIARQAGEIILRAGEETAADTADGLIVKAGHANFVTHYDGQVQAYLLDALSDILPEASFLGEEEGREVFRESYRTGDTFVVDPIDGTSNFMKGYRPSVVSIGLLRSGSPYLGVVYAPFTDQMFSAVLGEGAYENGRPIRTAEAPLSMSLAVMGTAPYYDGMPHLAFALADRYMPLCIDIRRSGSAAWDFCMVASGRSGYFFEPQMQLYDCAAGACILMEAGGTVTDLYGEPLTFDGPTSIAAASAGVARDPYLPHDLWGIDWMRDL